MDQSLGSNFQEYLQIIKSIYRYWTATQSIMHNHQLLDKLDLNSISSFEMFASSYNAVNSL